MTAGLWENHLHHLRARATVLTAAEKSEAADAAQPFGADPDDSSWVRVTPATAESRGRRRAHCELDDSRPGVDPLPPATSATSCICPCRSVGEFQLDCELTSSPGREIQVSYAGLAVGPKADLKHLERSQFGKPQTELTLNPPLEKLAEWYRYRLVVSGGR